VCNVFAPAQIHLSKPLSTPNTLAGLKIAAGSREASNVVARLGGTPISIPLPEYYEALQRGTIDGADIAWTAFEAFKLYEVTSYHIDTTLNGGAGLLFMSRKRYEALSPEARRIIDNNSGEKLSGEFGAFWDSEEDKGRRLVESKGEKQRIVDLTPQQTADWRQRTAAVVDDWVKTTPDGAKVLAEYKKLLADVRAGR
jgi:TRAP-type transport system periplasmic protein